MFDMFEVTTRVEAQKCDIDVCITDCLNFYTIVIYILSLKTHIFCKLKSTLRQNVILVTAFGISLH